MHQHLFGEFLASGDTLRVYDDERLVFSSGKGRLLPLLEYIDRFAPGRPQAAIFDRMVGNAAALLSIRSGCREVYSPLGSRLAVTTLEKYGVSYYLAEVVPYIEQPGGGGHVPHGAAVHGQEPAGILSGGDEPAAPGSGLITGP